MKKILPVILLSILYVFCINPTIKACSVQATPFRTLIEDFNPDIHIAVEGYYSSKTEFRVTRSSSDSIKTECDYSVFEYGPFGNRCKMYESSSRVDTNMMGEQNARLLIVYKDRSKNGKLVTPIFWGKGVDISNNKTIKVINNWIYKTSRYETISLKMIRKRLFENGRTPLVWKKGRKVR